MRVIFLEAVNANRILGGLSTFPQGAEWWFSLSAKSVRRSS